MVSYGLRLLYSKQERAGASASETSVQKVVGQESNRDNIWLMPCS